MLNRSQLQTRNTFGYKWKKVDTYDSRNMKDFSYKWLLSRYFGSEKNKNLFFRKYAGKSMLDAGCGSAYSARIIFDGLLNDIDYTGVDISSAALKVARKFFRGSGYTGKFIVGNIQNMKLRRKFDIIFSEGVIHHSSDPYASFKNLLSHLKPGGLIMFYVYRKKSVMREFTDDYVREYIRKMSNDEAWKALLPLTKLGIEIGRIKGKIKLSQDIDILGIKKGTYDLQRFFYYNICKAFYKKELSINEMNHINFDWFRPLNCFRFSDEEIKRWLRRSGLNTMRFVTEDSGFTVVAQKKKNR